MYKKILMSLFFLFWALPTLADVDTAWVRRYNGPGNGYDRARSLAVDDFGNVYVTGSSFGIETERDYATVKYRQDGDTLWVRRYDPGDSLADHAYAIAVDNAGNVYVTGSSIGSRGDFDCATIKYSPSGETCWVRRYSGPGNHTDGAGHIAVDTFRNVYVSGASYSCSTSYDYLTIKYDPDGCTIWVRTYNGPSNGDDGVGAIALDASGNLCVTGGSCGVGTSQDYTTVKYSPDGDTLWVRRYNGPGNRHDIPFAIAVDDSGNVYVTGESSGKGTGYDYATVKYFPNGDTAWVRRYDRQDPWLPNDKARAMALDASGNIYVTGSSRAKKTGWDYATVKYRPDGEVAWVRIYNGPDDSWDHARSIAVDNSGNAYVTGYNWREYGTYVDYATIKYNPDGRTDWVRTYNGTDNYIDWAFAIAVDNSANVYVTGASYGSGTNLDYTTIKYVQAITQVNNETEIGQELPQLALFQNYPNPFNQTTKIEFTLAKSGFVNLTIYDILGRKVRALVSEHVSSGYKSVLWDAKNDSGKEAASGIYFYRIQVGDFSEVKKLVLLK